MLDLIFFREADDVVVEFHHQPITKAPRAWDREVKTGSSTNHKGRKIWKRYGIRQRDVNKATSNPQGSAPATEISPRVIKRRCLVQLPIAPTPSYASKPSRYLPTLRDGVPSTPRSKFSSQGIQLRVCSESFFGIGKISKRKSLRASTFAPPYEAAEGTGLVQVQGDGECTASDQLSDVSENILANSPKGLVSECTDLRVEGELHQFPVVIAPSGKLTSPQSEKHPNPELSEQYFPGVPIADGDAETPSENSNDFQPHAMPPEDATSVLAIKVNFSSPDGCKTPSPNESKMKFYNTQSGTKRRRSRRQSMQTTYKTPPQNQGFTLAIPDQSDALTANVQNPILSLEDQDGALEGSLTKDPVSDDDIPTGKIPQGLLDVTKAAEQVPETHVKDAELPCKEAVEGECKLPTPNGPSEDQMSSVKVADGGCPDIQGISVANRTRSGARFSDDTSMLKDFLNRAQARKAAKSTETIPAPERADIPRRSPRKILGQLDKNSPSPTKTRDSAHRPGTPPGKALTGLTGYDDADELCSEPVVHRRSARKCPSAKKEAPGAPSFIPVRRPDGADPVVLQKSVAQELAMITRANTRRNKGISKLPKLMLETLASKVVEDMPAKKRETRSTKSVEWDEKLVYPRENSCSGEGQEDITETRSKVGRLRGLGSHNGTPARKTTGSKIPSNGTPAPKRRGRTKA